MRQGENPVKNKLEENRLKPHRVIVVFYIPDSDDAYFKDLDIVLDKCLESLTKTINFETTNITLLNNNSSKKVDFVLDKYKEFIDKYVYYSENKGKVYAVINEVRGVFEPFVTIADADVLFYSGWENAVFEIFDKIPKAGVVSPMPLPYLTLHFNQSVFGFSSLKGQIKYGKYVDDADIDLYLKGTNLPKLIDRKTKYDWKQKQFILDQNNCVSVVGAYHVVSTYRTEQFRNIYTFPAIKFKNSYENYFIDSLADVKGLYRLSTIKTFAYHMGNTTDDVVLNHSYDDLKKIKQTVFKSIKPYQKQSSLLLFCKRIIGRIFIKFLWNK